MIWKMIRLNESSGLCFCNMELNNMYMGGTNYAIITLHVHPQARVAVFSPGLFEGIVEGGAGGRARRWEKSFCYYYFVQLLFLYSSPFGKEVK